MYHDILLTSLDSPLILSYVWNKMLIGQVVDRVSIPTLKIQFVIEYWLIYTEKDPTLWNKNESRKEGTERKNQQHPWYKNLGALRSFVTCGKKRRTFPVYSLFVLVSSRLICTFVCVLPCVSGAANSRNWETNMVLFLRHKDRSLPKPDLNTLHLLSSLSDFKNERDNPEPFWVLPPPQTQVLLSPANTLFSSP